MDEVLDQQAEKLAITRRIAGDIKDIWLLQPRFEKRAGRAPLSPDRTAALPRRLGLPGAARRKRRDRPQELADWWADFQDAGHDEREAMLLPDTGQEAQAPLARTRPQGRRRQAPASETRMIRCLRRAGLQSRQSRCDGRRRHRRHGRAARLAAQGASPRSTAPRRSASRHQPDFINAVVALDTRSAGAELLDELFALEARFGRVASRQRQERAAHPRPRPAAARRSVRTIRN